MSKNFCYINAVIKEQLEIHDNDVGLLNGVSEALSILVKLCFDVSEPIESYRLIDLSVLRGTRSSQIALAGKIGGTNKFLSQYSVFLLSIYMLVYNKILEGKHTTIDTDNFDSFNLFNEINFNRETLEREIRKFNNLPCAYEDIEVPEQHYNEIRKIIPKELAGLVYPWLPFFKQKSLILSGMSPNIINSENTTSQMYTFVEVFEILGVTFIDGLIMLMNSKDESMQYLSQFLQQLVPELLNTNIFQRAISNALYSKVKYARYGRDTVNKNTTKDYKVIKKEQLEYKKMESQLKSFEEHLEALNSKLIVRVDLLKQDLNSTKKMFEDILASQKELIELVRKDSSSNIKNHNENDPIIAIKNNSSYSFLDENIMGTRPGQTPSEIENDRLNIGSPQVTTTLPPLGDQMSLKSRNQHNKINEKNERESAISVAKTLSSNKSQPTRSYQTPDNQPTLLPNLIPTGKFTSPQASEQLIPFSPSPKTFDLSTPDTNTILSYSDLEYRPLIRNNSSSYNMTRNVSINTTPKLRSLDEQAIKLPPIGKNPKSYILH